MLIKVKNNVPATYSIGQLRRDNPNVSFPARPSEEVLAKWEVYSCKTIIPSNPDEMIWIIVDDKFDFVNGEWFFLQKLEKLPLSEAAANVRHFRNDLLASSDWTQLSDATVDKVAWAEYRQQLRDVSAQPTFPYDVNWPIKPV